MKNLVHTALLCTAAALSACGGGGGGGGAAVANAVAEGVWNGTSSTGYDISVLALENGDFYAMSGTITSNVFYVAGFDQGTASISGSAMTSSLKEYFRDGSTYTGTLNATVVTGVSLKGSATYSSGVTSTFTATPSSPTSYNYSTPAAISDVAGSWTGQMLNGTAATVTISASGVISGTNGGCTFTGTATPRSSGKNVFNVAITFGAVSCALPNQSATGIAIVYAAGNGLKQLLVAVQDSTKAHGTMFTAQK